MGNEDRLEEIASAILDGKAIDWETAESDAGGADRSLFQHLKSVAALAAVHRLPTTWGHLQVIERIGRGTFGEVYRAFDPRLDREVALKLLPATHTDGSPAGSFIPEGRLLARVRHSNIVTIHGAEELAGQVGLWMELVRGRTLEQVLSQQGLFSTTEATRIGRDLCGAVSAVHSAGLLHRDIKAHNAMLSDDGRVALMDFGTGREFSDGAISDLAGTPLYVAPEVLGGQPASIQSDVYSLGVLLFHILSGRYPVEGRTVSDIRAAHRTGSPVRLRDARPDVPALLAKAVERAVDPIPGRRFPTAAAFGAALERVAAGVTAFDRRGDNPSRSEARPCRLESFAARSASGRSARRTRQPVRARSKLGKRADVVSQSAHTEREPDRNAQRFRARSAHADRGHGRSPASPRRGAHRRSIVARREKDPGAHLRRGRPVSGRH